MSGTVKRRAPGKRGSLLMGNLAEYKRDPIDMLLRHRLAYGDVVRNRLGPFLTHALTHPDHVEHVLQENHRNYVRGRFYDNFKLFFGDGLLTTEGAFWRRHRRAVQPGFHKRQLDATTGAVGLAATQLVARWSQLGDQPVDVVPAMMHLSLAALGRMVFNTDISHTADDVGPAVRFGLEAMMPQGNLNDFIPRWAPTPFNRRINTARSAIDRVIAQVIDAHRIGSCDASDVISLLLAARDPETGAPMSEQEVHDEVMTIFLAGHETTGSGLAWALYALAQHPGVLRRLREELHGKLGGRAPSAADLEDLPYLAQVVNEALRVYPPIWGYTRDLVEDDEIGGFHIPAGSSIFLSPYVTHRHPAFWPNPEAFDPENFASGAPQRHRYAYFPFGGGMRKCIGYQMALVIMRVVLGTVVQHLDLSVLPGHPIERGALVALRPLQGIQLMVRPTQAPRSMPAPCAEPATSDEGSSGKAFRFTWFPVETRLPPAEPDASLAGKRIVVVNGAPGVAEQVAHHLTSCGACARVFGAEAVQAVDGIVDLGLAAPFALADTGDWESAMRRTLGLLQACYGDWLAEESARRCFYLAVTWMDGRMGYGGAPVSGAQPLGGIWAGFAKTLPQELPNCNIRILDLAPDEAANAGPRIAAELYRWGLFEIGYAGGRRYTLQAARSDLPATAQAVGPGDVVLFSGGARGIGLLCARAIAERHGATVIITGRDAPAEGHEPWAELDEAAFKVYAHDQLRAATKQNSVVAIRREMARLQHRRALRATLAAIAAQGLPIQYRVCDVTDAAAVRRLCDGFRGTLRMVIHNAGVDRPVRLAQKNADDFIGVVRTKVAGFVNLCAAVADHPRLVRFCNVGSLTGRWGGMTGETDYAAANEALARLGLWSAQNGLRCPVTTLDWPTWDGVGMITNLDVTRQYVATMDVADGIAHWLAELDGGPGGEVMFMGAVGGAVTPIQIRGFGPVLGLPNIAQLVTLHHHVGEPEIFRPFARLVTQYRIDGDTAGFLNAYRLDDRPALPSAILMEHACGVGGWIMPDAARRLALTGLADVSVDLAAAILPEGGAVLRTEASGRWQGEAWLVDIRCTMVATGRTVLLLTLVHREMPVPMSEEIIAVDEGAPRAAGPMARRAVWNDHKLRAAQWHVDAVSAADFWALPLPPTLRLPVNHIENVLRACWGASPAAEDARGNVWHIARVSLTPDAAVAARYVIARVNGDYAIADRQGRVVMEIQGIALVASEAAKEAA